MKDSLHIVEVSSDKLEDLLARIEKEFGKNDYEMLRQLIDAYNTIVQLVEEKKTSIRRLRKILFGSRSEKTSKVVDAGPNQQSKSDDDSDSDDSLVEGKVPADEQEDNAGGVDDDKAQNNSADNAGDDKAQNNSADNADEKNKRPGHGRKGAKDYRGAQVVNIPHETLSEKDRCPACDKGKLYEDKNPKVIVRIVGQAPVAATVYKMQKLRCNLCGKSYSASCPDGVGEEKYTASATSMIANLKYGVGLPFYRLSRLEGNHGIPLAPSTQWECVRDGAAYLKPVHEELKRQAAQGDILHNDDTTVKILEYMKDGKPSPRVAENGTVRKGMFTTGIVSVVGQQKIVLFFTGHNHAGENLENKILALREETHGPPIQMCDALSRNVPKELKTILANCMSHARRQFVDVVDMFPHECQFILLQLREVYKNDAISRKKKMTPQQRLDFHQAQSKPLMDELKQWLVKQIDDKMVEPNSGLGQAIAYMLKHWDKLTLFLSVAGAPIDNNICERGLKKAILHRKNSLFFKTQNGADVGDLFMSLIHTAEMAGADPFDYITTLLLHRDKLKNAPANWMPWNYREAVASF